MWYCQLSYSVCRRTLVIDFLNCAWHYQRGNEPWCGLPLVTEESIHQQDANIWYHGWHREIRSPWQLQSGQPEMKIYKLQPAPSQFSVNQILNKHFIRDEGKFCNKQFYPKFYKKVVERSLVLIESHKVYNVHQSIFISI